MRSQELPIEATTDGLLLHDPYEPMGLPPDEPEKRRF